MFYGSQDSKNARGHRRLAYLLLALFTGTLATGYLLYVRLYPQLQAARRELEEEVGVTAAENDMGLRGILTFHSETPDFNWKVHVFVVRKWFGEPIETEEMRPQWFAHGEIPYEAMWADDRYWLPLILAGRKVEGDFYFDGTGEKLEKHEIREV